MNCSKKFIMDKCNNNNNLHCQRKCTLVKWKNCITKNYKNII